jgi:hypothetical protein
MDGERVLIFAKAAQLSPQDFGDFFARLGMDLAAALLISAVIYLRRHLRRDRFLIFMAFNLGVFSVLSVITERKISAAVGFGLFALLSIIRLRSQPFGNIDLAYFFSALVLGVVNGIGHGDLRLNAIVSALIVLSLFVLDHPRIQTRFERRRVTLDAVYTDLPALHQELQRRLGLDIVEVRITSIDYVRETTSVSVRYKAPDRAIFDDVDEPETGEAE